jgi:hypothetical protein
MIGKLLTSDQLKMKRTSLWLVTILVPFVTVLLKLAESLIRYDYYVKEVNKTGDWWTTHLNILIGIMVFAVPVGITITCSVIANTEHQSKGWKHTLALPLSRTGVYVSKFTWAVICSLISALLLTVGLALFGLCLGAKDPIPWIILFKNSFVPYISSLPIIAFQLWLSMVIRNQAFSITIGTVSAMVGLFLNFGDFTRWLPWAYPLQSFAFIMSEKGMVPNPDLLLMNLLGLGIGIVLLFIGAKDFARRDIY